MDHADGVVGLVPADGDDHHRYPGRQGPDHRAVTSVGDDQIDVGEDRAVRRGLDHVHVGAERARRTGNGARVRW